MKTRKFLLFALSALALAGCSSDKIDVVDDSTKGFDENGNGYVALSINLPTRGSDATRSNENDQYDDGTADEYKVNDATLILFDGDDTNELTATFGEALDLNFNMNNDVDGDNITVQGRVTEKITNTYHKYKYALVVLNRNNVFTVQDKKLYFNGDAFTGTFADFLAKTTASEKNLNTTGFFMTNAVLTDTKGNAAPSSPKVKTLVDVSDHIYKTQAEAESNPAVDVIVERAVAKVQVENQMGESGNSDELLLTSGGQTLYVKDFTWELCNKNASSYLVRNWLTSSNAYDNSWLSLYSDGDGLPTKDTDLPAALTSTSDAYNAYRFAGIKAITASGSTVVGTNPAGTYYRTYFGVDPNYETDLGAAAPTADGFTLESGKIAYCLENTFNVAHQTVKNTTCAVIKVTFSLTDGGDAADFYVLNGTTSTVYTAGASTDTKSLNSFVLSYVLNHYQAELKTLASESKIDATKELKGSACTVSLDNSDKSGAQKITEIALTVTDGTNSADVTIDTTTKLDGSESNTVLDQLNSLLNIDLYKGGVAYYTVLIKHFGDDLTPWNTENRSNTQTYAYEPGGTDAGTTADDRWLGRYGVLRNNWYEVDVTGVKRLGSSTIPTVTTDETTDDKIEQYLSVRVHVLSWAKRTQSTILQ